MSIGACAAIVRRGDPDRFLAAMAAPLAARQVLFPIYAFNLEVARAPWASAEPMIAEMRLQWWRDAVDEIAAGRPVRHHEVTTALAAVLAPGLAVGLDEFVAVRRWDIYRDPFENQEHFDRYIDRGAGTLMVVAARALGPGDEAVLRDFGYAAGVANWLRAVPDLVARKRIPLLDGSHQGIRALAGQALARLHRARAGRHLVSRPAAPALLAGWQAGRVLAQALRDPARVADGRLGYSEAGKRLALMARAASGRW
jgi:phytoene/squalene synthetase